MSEAKAGDRVRVHYTGRLADGTVFDSSEQREPLEFTIGAGEVIEGFEQGVTGMATGEERHVVIPPDKAYGDRNEELVMTVERTALPQGLDPQPGDRLQLTDRQGRRHVVEVVETDDDTITLDGNHPLAGQELTFDIRLVEVEPVG